MKNRYYIEIVTERKRDSRLMADIEFALEYENLQMKIKVWDVFDRED